jgi:hypothetical protein
METTPGSTQKDRTETTVAVEDGLASQAPGGSL